MPRIRILLADDHALVRAGIRSLLEQQPDMEVVGEAANGQEAIESVCDLRPDVVIMDIAMPGTTGLEATRHIKSRLPEVRILTLTMLEDERYFFQSIHAGASGFIVKGALPEEFLVAVRTVAAKQVYLYPSLNKKLVEEYLSCAHADPTGTAPKALTDREQQVVRLIAEGRTRREIADQLGISPNTVERHRQNVMAKLDLHNRAALVKYAIRKGLIEVDM
jgi:two-component system, NarL family, response regulator NreC